jgi:hypothetical protein
MNESSNQQRPTQRAPDWWALRVRVFRQFVWLEVGSVKATLSRSTHQRVTPAVSAT